MADTPCTGTGSARRVYLPLYQPLRFSLLPNFNRTSSRRAALSLLLLRPTPFGDFSAPRPRPRLAKYCLPRVVRRALGPARPAATCDSPRWRSHSRLSAARCDRTARCDPLDCGERAAPPPEFYPARGPCLAAPPLGLVGSARIPRSLSSTTVAAVVSAPLREGRLAAPPLGPVGPARIPRSLPSTTVAAVVSAPLRERAAPLPGFYPARGPCLAAPPLGPVGPARIPRSLPSTTVAAVVSAPLREGCLAAPPLGPVGPARIPRSLSTKPVLGLGARRTYLLNTISFSLSRRWA